MMGEKDTSDLASPSINVSNKETNYKNKEIKEITLSNSNIADNNDEIKMKNGNNEEKEGDDEVLNNEINKIDTAPKTDITTDNGNCSPSKKRARFSSPLSIDDEPKILKIIENSDDIYNDQLNNGAQHGQQKTDEDMKCEEDKNNNGGKEQEQSLSNEQKDKNIPESSIDETSMKLDKDTKQQSKSKPAIRNSHLDVWDRVPPKDVLTTCTNCNKVVGVSRFAQHLDKCLGIGNVRKSSMS